jgi:hypothetical protein
VALVELKSSVLVGADYDVPTRILTLAFMSGKQYQYADVPLTVYQELVLADSPGKYYGEHIRGHFKAPDTSK